MLKLKSNYKNKHENLTCDLCGKEEDKTEHLFECNTLKDLNKGNYKMEDLQSPTRGIARYIIQVMDLRKVRN